MQVCKSMGIQQGYWIFIRLWALEEKSILIFMKGMPLLTSKNLWKGNNNVHCANHRCRGQHSIWSIRSTDISSCIQKYEWIGYLEKKWMQSADGDGQQASIITVALLGIETHLLSGSQILFPVMLVGKTVLGKLMHIVTLLITEQIPMSKIYCGNSCTHSHLHLLCLRSGCKLVYNGNLSIQ